MGRGFMEKCEKDYRGIGFLRQMIGMLKSLGFQVLCEGVESARQVEVLKTSGCDHVQGNWFSMPLSAKEFEKMLFLPGEIFCRCRKNEEHSTGGEA
ncbi:EAL domain-containing protein [Blautia sp. DFI.4.84]|nr:EAL domain-containing protein [Blautia sp. DFI.4.84]